MTVRREQSAEASHPGRFPLPLQSVRDKIAIVTGASSGIGRAIALSLAGEGAQLWLVGRRPDPLEEVANLVKGYSSSVRPFRADLTSDEDIHALAAQVQVTCGRLDMLIHSAGEIHHAEHASASLSHLDRQYRANVRGPYLLTQVLLPLLRIGRGQIVFINSSSGLRARGRNGQFAATQHALKAVAESLREEVNPDGIRVLSVFPGRTATPRTEMLFREERKDYRPDLLMQPDDVATIVVHALKVPRTAEVTDISIRPLVKSY
jgi:NADP-dependent 3-hydroxy acid dehydrogenase YdfG